MSSKSMTFIVPSMSTRRYAPKPMPVKKTRTTRLAATPSAPLPDRLPSAPKLELKPLVLVHKLKTGQPIPPSQPPIIPERSEDVRVNASTRRKPVSKSPTAAKSARALPKKQTVPKQGQAFTNARQVAIVGVPAQIRLPSRIPRISQGALAGRTTTVTLRQITPVPGSCIPLPVHRTSPATRNVENDCPIVQKTLHTSNERARVDAKLSQFNISRPPIPVSTTVDDLEPACNELHCQKSKAVVDVALITPSTSPIPTPSTSALVAEPVGTSTRSPPQESGADRSPVVSGLELSPESTISSPTTSIFSSKGSSSLSDVSTPPSVSSGNKSPWVVPESPIANLAKVFVNSERIRKLYIPPLAEDAKASHNWMTQMEIDALRAQRKVAGGGAASVPSMERLGSLSGIAIVSKLRAQWEGRK